MFVALNQNVPPRVSPNQNVPPGSHSSWFLVPPGEQFVFKVLEFKEYYKEKCTREDKNSNYNSTLLCIITMLHYYNKYQELIYLTN